MTAKENGAPGQPGERAWRAGWARDGFPRKSKEEARPGSWTELLKAREKPKWDTFSWLTVRALFESVNDLLAKRRPEIVDERRARWMAGQRGRTAASADLIFEPPGTVSSPDGERAFFLVGDTGEQDASQYALAPYFAAGDAHRDPEGRSLEPEFMVIVSDVIYPAGDVNEYVNGFYIPYQGFRKPIYAIPGNHDWYDGLDGFMYHFCGAEPLLSERFRETETRPSARLARGLWRGAEAPERDRLNQWRDSRPWGRDATKAVQPAPYFAIDLGDLLVVAIDTGVTGAIDDEQGRWLVRVSAQPKQKILLTGKPIYVDGAYRPGTISWKLTKGQREKPDSQPQFKTVDDVVRHEPFGYVAAIGGDVHNYQRYPVRLTAQQRTIHYIVSGGGGAYISPTHRIPPVGGPPRETAHKWPADLSMPADEDRLEGGDEAEGEPRTFRCYPRRGDSLAYAARRAGPRMFNAVQLAAAAFVAATTMLLYGLPLDWTGSLALINAYLPLAAIAGVALLAKRKGRKGSESRKARHILVGAGFLIVFAFALVASVMELASDDDLLSNPRFWGTAGIALLVPALIVAAILWAHDLRGSTPSALPQLALVGAFAAAIPISCPFGPVGAAPAWFVTTAFVALFMGAGMLALSLARACWVHPGGPLAARLLDGAVAVAAPATLAVAVAVSTDGDRFLLFGAALVFSGAYAYGWSLYFKTYHPPMLDGADLLARRFSHATNLLAVFAWMTVAATLLHLIGDGWVATAAIGAIAALLMAAIVALLFVLARGTKRKRFGLALGLALALPFSRLFAVLLPWLFAAAIYVALGLALLGTVLLAVKALRRGEINAIWAQAQIESLLDGGDGVAVEAPQSDEREREVSLFRLLYPYRWKEKVAQGAAQTGALPETIAKLVAELSDSDEPPFFRNFLRVDIRPHEEPGKPEDRELRIRCFGVTGYALEEEGDTPLVDELSIPFRSRERLPG